MNKQIEFRGFRLPFSNFILCRQDKLMWLGDGHVTRNGLVPQAPMMILTIQRGRDTTLPISLK